jgi:hypothetical protein
MQAGSQPEINEKRQFNSETELIVVALLAEISLGSSRADKRDSIRRTLRLVAEVAYSKDSARVLILNLSESGVLIETAAVLAVGESLELELPEAGITVARVVWQRGREFGCEFEAPVSKAAVSGALLRSLPAEGPPHTAMRGEWEEFPGPRDEDAEMLVLMAILFVAILFIAALLTLPFSADQFGI